MAVLLSRGGWRPAGTAENFMVTGYKRPGKCDKITENREAL